MVRAAVREITPQASASRTSAATIGVAVMLGDRRLAICRTELAT